MSKELRVKQNSDLVEAIASKYERSNPAHAYLMSLRSAESKRVMESHLNNACCLIWKCNLHDAPWELLSRDHILVWLEVMSNTISEKTKKILSPASINTALSALKGVAKEAKIKKIITIEDFDNIKDIKSVRGSRATKGRALVSSEVSALLTDCKNDQSASGIRDFAIISVLVGCGLRRREIVSLQLSDVLFHQNELRIIGKGNKERLQPCPEYVLSAIKLWIQEVRGESPGSLFNRIRKNDDVTLDGLSPQAVYYILGERGITSNIDRFSPHDLRRTYATWLLEEGEDLVIVRDLMGHASILTTQKYRMVDRNKMHSAAKKVRLPI